MENREAFTGILAEPEESIEEVNWRQNNYNQIQTEVVTEVTIEAVAISTAQLQEEEVTMPMEVTKEIMVKQRKQVLQATQM